MPATTLYDSTREMLSGFLPEIPDTQLQNLSLAVAAAVQSVSGQLGTLARALPLASKQQSKEQRLRRFLDNPAVTASSHYHPVLRAQLEAHSEPLKHLLLDRVVLNSKHNVLGCCLALRRRSIPLSAEVLPHNGSSDEEQQKRVLSEAMALLPAGSKCVVHADSEFRSCALFQWLVAQGHIPMLGTRGLTLVADSTQPSAPQCTIEQRLGQRRDVLYLQSVYVTAERFGPVNLMAWWSKDDRNEPIVRAVMTPLPANARTYRQGKRRMWIETLFRDWQSGGFHLHRNGIPSPSRFLRLLLVLMLAYLCFLSVGRWLVKRGLRPLIDSGSSRHWQWSLFQLGVGWKEHLAAFGLPFLPFIYIYD